MFVYMYSAVEQLTIFGWVNTCRAEVIMLTTLYIILFRISYNYSALCSKSHVFICKILFSKLL